MTTLSFMCLYLSFICGMLLGVYIGYGTLYDDLFGKRMRSSRVLSNGLVMDEEEEETVYAKPEGAVCIDAFKKQSKSYNCLGSIGKLKGKEGIRYE